MATVLLGLFGNGRVDAIYRCQTPLDPVVPSVQDGVRTTKDETDCLGAVLDGVDGRRRPSTTDAQNWSMRQILVLK